MYGLKNPDTGKILKTFSTKQEAKYWQDKSTLLPIIKYQIVKIKKNQNEKI
jgi:hypothetical protein